MSRLLAGGGGLSMGSIHRLGAYCDAVCLMSTHSYFVLSYIIGAYRFGYLPRYELDDPKVVSLCEPTELVTVMFLGWCCSLLVALCLLLFAVVRRDWTRPNLILGGVVAVSGVVAFCTPCIGWCLD